MKTRSSSKSATARSSPQTTPPSRRLHQKSCSIYRESRTRSISRPRTRMATKRGQSPLEGCPRKRLKGDENLLIEHELSGKPGSKWLRTGIPSCNPYRGSVYEVGRTFSKLINDINKGTITSYPDEFVQSLRQDKLEANLVSSVDKLVDKKGFAFYSSDTKLCLNLLEAEQRPDSVICDVIILTHTHLPIVITVQDGHHFDDVIKYNHSLSRELTFTMRNFTDEGFNMFDAVVDINDISKDVLKKVLSDVCFDYKRNVPVERLCMSRERCMALTRALLAQGYTSSVNPSLETQISANLKHLETSKNRSSDQKTGAGSTKHVTPFEEDSVFLMTPDQFRFLNMCVNSGRVWLVSSRPGTGKIRFALETARRLSLQGPTLVLCESDDFRNKIRYLRNMHVVTRPELQTNPSICRAYVNFVVVKAEQMEFQSGKELIFDWHHNLEQAIHSRGGKLVIVYDRRDDADIDNSDIQVLESRKKDLKTCLIPDDIVLELLSKKVLSIADLIWIKKRRTREDQNEELLNSLKRSSRRGYDIFLRALRKTRQGHLADLLETGGDPKDILMSSEHDELLHSARDHLIHCMIPFGVLGRLYKTGIFTSSDISRIQAENSIDVINQMLLDYLSGKPDRCFGFLLEALERTCQDHLKEMLLSGDFETIPARTVDDDKITAQVKDTLLDKVDIEDLLLELECSYLIHKDDLRYIRFGNNLGKALPDPSTTELHSTKATEPVRQVVDRLFELLSRKSTSPCETLMECLRRTGQYEVVQILHNLQGVSTSQYMDTDDTGSTYRTLDVKFIETKAFQAVLDKLMDPTEIFIVLTGAPGEGKTTAALQAMRHKGLQIRKLVIKSPEEFNKQVTMDTPTTVVLDDVFGIVEVNETAVRQWIPILQRIKKHSENKTGPSINIIITSRNHVWRAAESLADLNEIIPVSSVIDFTVLVPLVRPEKKRMLDTHLDKYGIDLDTALVDRIAETHGTLGFPLCCKLFAAEPMFQDNPVDFFTNPLNYIVKILVSSCEDPSNLTLIKQVVMSKGQLDRKKAAIGSINDQSVANMKNYVFQEGNILYFPHKSIADAASYVMATQFSIDYLGECSLQFLYERVREKPTRGQSSDADIQIHVNQKDLQSLIHRLANEMSAGNLALACSHPALTTKKSVTKLFSQFKDIRKTVHLKDKKHGGSFLYWTTWNNSEHLCKETLESFENIPEADLCEAVLGCCLSGNKNALKELLTRTDLSAVRASGIRDLPKISTRQQLVANESVRVIEISGERMAHLACKYGQTEIVEILMEHGLNLNETDLNGETCLLAACLGDNPTAVSYLLQNNAQWSQDNDGHTPLHLAIEKENADVLKLLLEHESAKEFLNKTDTDGQSPLHLACLKKSPEMVELLLEQKANVDVTDSCGWTPLHYVSWIGNRRIMDILIKYNADVNAACKESSMKPRSPAKLKGSGPTETEGMTALHLACHQGHVGIVKKLTDLQDIDVNITDVFGKSALYIASKRGNSNLVKILLDHKADTSLATFDSRTAVYAASKKGHDQVIKLLCESGTDLNTGTKSQRKRNPLYAASRKGYVSAVDTLLQHGADVNFQDSEGNTSLHIASAAGQTDVVKCLLKWGADVMARNSSQLTPLHEAVAVTNPDNDTIDYLLLAGADVNAVDSRKWTPLHLASLCGTGEIVKTLLLWKADVRARDMTDMTALGYASAMGKVDNVSVLLKHHAFIDNVCQYLAVIYGHAEAVGVLLEEKLAVKEVDEMYSLAKQYGHDKVVDIITRYRPIETQ